MLLGKYCKQGFSYTDDVQQASVVYTYNTCVYFCLCVINVVPHVCTIHVNV